MSIKENIDLLDSEIQKLKKAPMLSKVNQAEKCLDIAMAVIILIAQKLEDCQGIDLKPGGSL